MSTHMEGATVKEYARTYVDVLNGPANGWGQHYHQPTNTSSGWMYHTGKTRYGQKLWDDTVSATFKEMRHDIHRHRSAQNAG